MIRHEDETYEDYKIRRKKEKEDLQFKLKGELFWESKRDGTYKKDLQRNQSNIEKTNSE